MAVGFCAATGLTAALWIISRTARNLRSDTVLFPSNIKNQILEQRLFAWRAWVGLLLLVVLIGVLVSRLVFLQLVEFDRYQTLSENNRVKTLPVAPSRGLIFDRNGVLLAGNRPSYRLELVPEQVENLTQTVNRLRTYLDISAYQLKKFRALVARKPSFESIPLRSNLSEEEVAVFSVNQHHFPGVHVAAGLMRFYPKAATLSHVVGYVGQISEADFSTIRSADYAGTSYVGKTGVEKFYEHRLLGKPGVQQVEVNAQGRVVRTLDVTSSQPGKDIYLSIDAKLQAYASEMLQQHTGAVVGMDPMTGEVLLLVSKPGFDPNLFVSGISQKSYSKILSSVDKPLYNRAIRGLYPPGSTQKPFVALAGLASGKWKAERRLYCPGFYQMPGKEHKYRDWKTAGHGPVNLDHAIAESCDVYFYQLAHDIEIEAIHRALDYFGFGQKTGIDLLGEKRGINPSAGWKRQTKGKAWYPGETIISGIGQGFNLVTPLQLTAATAKLAQRGHAVKPRITRVSPVQVNADIDADKSEATTGPKNGYEPHYDAVIEAMHHVVQSRYGSARKSGAGAAYAYAGKTGTAQVFSVKQDEKYDEEGLAKKLKDHSLFIAFAPLNQPKIALSVVVENGGSGSRVAAPIARKIIDFYLSDKL